MILAIWYIEIKDKKHKHKHKDKYKVGHSPEKDKKKKHKKHKEAKIHNLDSIEIEQKSKDEYLEQQKLIERDNKR
jgi:hypothetical protein